MLGEANSVVSNIICLCMYKDNQESEAKNRYANESMLINFLRNYSDEEIARLLRNKFSIRENQTIQLSPELLQQRADNQIPVGAVWLQGLIDTRRINEIPGFEDVTTVRQAIERINRNNRDDFFNEIKKDSSFVEEQIAEDEAKIGEVSVPVSQLYFVVPDKDLDRWLKVLARCDSIPKGIIVYRHNAVRLEHFATPFRGDHEALTNEIREVIPKSTQTINYEDILKQVITPDKLVGYRRHVIGEIYLANRRAIIKDENGNLVIK